MNKIIFNKILQRLKSKELKYSVQKDVIILNMDISGVIGKATIIIDILDKAYVTYTVMSSKVDEKHRALVAEYLHRANYGLLFGNFEMDYNDGEIRYKLITDCEDNNLSDYAIDRSVILPCLMLEKYGNGIIKLMLDFGNPKNLIKEAEDKVDK